MQTRRNLVTFALCVASISLLSAGRIDAQAGSAASTDSLSLRHRVRGPVVSANTGALESITVASDFRHIGGQRFILSSVADAEQHVFVDADAQGNVRRLYWLQFENFLPSRPGNTYNYDSDSLVSIGGLDWRVGVRRYSTTPQAGSDRAAMTSLLERNGLRAPRVATRVRMVYLPTADRRSEVMIIYAAAATDSTPPSNEEITSLIESAKTGLKLVKFTR